MAEREDGSTQQAGVRSPVTGDARPDPAPAAARQPRSASRPPREILVCLDRSERAERPLEHAAVLARRFGARLNLLHVLEHPAPSAATLALAPPDPLGWEILRADAKRYLEGVERRLAADGLEARVRLVEGHAPTRIIQEARGIGADIVVLASHGAHGPTCWALGHTAQIVAARTSASLLIVPTFGIASAERPPAALRRILVPLDGSLRAECVLPLVIELGRQARAQVRLLHVLRPPEALSLPFLTAEVRELGLRLEQSCRLLASRYLEDVAERLENAGVSARAFVERDTDVRDAITSWARREDLDLIVMAAHGLTGNRCEPRGSIAQHLLMRGTLPMLIVQDVPPEEGNWDIEIPVDEPARRPADLYPHERP